jgi:RNA polymerase sigma-70 factor (ECF subfamily)
VVDPAVDDLALVRRVLSGEEAAFETFFEGHFPRLYRFVLPRLGGNPQSAEDVVQTTLVKAMTRLDTYRGEAALFTWLCTLCRHEIAAHFRTAGRREVHLAEDTPEIRTALDTLSIPAAEGPDEQLRRKELARIVQVVLDRLPGRYGDALEWKYIHGLPVREIADRLEIGPKAAESLLTRARQAFREGMMTLGPEARGAERWLDG